MAYTLGTMRAIALDMADVTGDAHIDINMVNHWFNLELGALNDLLISSEENYFCAKTTIPLVAGQRTYPVPNNLYRITKLWYLGNGSTIRTPMRRVNLDNIDCQVNQGGNVYLGYNAPLYEFVDRNIELAAGSIPGTMVLWYVPTYAALTDDNQTISPAIPSSYADWVMLGVAIRARIKEESDPSMLLAKRADVEGRIVALMSQRDQGEAMQTCDVYVDRRNALRYHVLGRR